MGLSPISEISFEFYFTQAEYYDTVNKNFSKV